jgi:hypothetical protein
MCDPITASIAIAVVATTAGVVAKNQAVKAQAKAINNQLSVVNEENRQKASGELFDAMRATRREQGRIRAAAGEAGLSTSSGNIEALLSDSQMQGGLSQQRLLANMESRQRANNAEAESSLSQLQKTTALGAGIQIASAAGNAYIGAGGKFGGA